MWKCQRCGKPVYFAERRQSLGYDWHRQCLRCDECDKVLTVGQHAEHKGVPYCYVPCYSVLFGPKLFGHGSTVESHQSFGKRNTQDSKRFQFEKNIRIYNDYFDTITNNATTNNNSSCNLEGSKFKVNTRDVNGRLVLDGVLRVYWGIKKSIRLKEYDDKRLKASQMSKYSSFDINNYIVENRQATLPIGHFSSFSIKRSLSYNEEYNYKTLPAKLDSRSLASIGDLLHANKNKQYYNVHSNLNITSLLDDSKCEALIASSSPIKENDLAVSKPKLRRTPGRKFDDVKRRSNINGHWYDRDTSVFTPPPNSYMSVYVTSLNSTSEVLKALLNKYQIESGLEQFALYLLKENGEQRKLLDNEFPLELRVNIGPRESLAKLYILDQNTTNNINHEVAQYLNLSYTECRNILNMFYDEEEREVMKIKEKFCSMKIAIWSRLQTLT